MQICQIVALVTEQEFRDAATSVCERLFQIDPDMSKLGVLSWWLFPRYISANISPHPPYAVLDT